MNGDTSIYTMQRLMGYTMEIMQSLFRYCPHTRPYMCGIGLPSPPVDELAEHSHITEAMVWSDISNVADGYRLRGDLGADDTLTDGWILNSHLKNPSKSTSTGNNASHNNMEPYKVVYIFKRTA